MEEQDSQKIFGLLESLMMVFLALLNDALLIISEILAVFTVGGSIVVIEIINVAIWAILLLWFIIRTKSFGTIGWIQTIGGIIESIGIPGKTITTLACIYIANRPKLATTVQLASGKAGALKGAASQTTQLESRAAQISSMNKRSEELARNWGEKINQKTGGRFIGGGEDEKNQKNSEFSQEGFIDRNLENVSGSSFKDIASNEAENSYKQKASPETNNNEIDLRNAA